jgi:endogenous inhibitor of DNA gyrase (YacG/DUF329 family)
LEQSVADFKRSVQAASKAVKRINTYVPCVNCGKYVKRYLSQRVQAKRSFCSRKCKAVYYQGLHKWSNYNQHAFGVSLVIAESMLLQVDPWSLAEKGAAFS